MRRAPRFATRLHSARWHGSHADDTGPGGESELKAIEQFAAEQNTLPARDPSRRGSGAQQDARTLYKQLLRESLRKSDPQARQNLQEYIKAEFRRNAEMPKNQYNRIDWSLRRGKAHLEMLQNSNPADGFSVYASRA
ncbi:hypothetical protein DIPPA_03095 [Diplonema papillatum]|nr:hypothetical protein DIPPA_17403 [Diplonema papillatum]KAJ9443275.1 hypothetical protein DIPPA_03095 [Diplonema papillatum]